MCCAMWQIFGFGFNMWKFHWKTGWFQMPPFPACPLQILQIVFLKRADGAEKVEKLLEGVRAGARRNRNDPCSSSCCCCSACIPFFVAKTCFSILSSSAAFSSASASGPGASQFFLHCIWNIVWFVFTPGPGWVFTLQTKSFNTGFLTEKKILRQKISEPPLIPPPSHS